MPKDCDLSLLDNRKTDVERGENGLYCGRQSYSYSLAGESAQDLNTIFEKKFTVAGAAKEGLTVLFDLTLAFDFAASAQLKALIRRVDPGHVDAEYVYDPLSCLYEHSCVESVQSGKNELNINAILTSGAYELIIFDQQENAVRRWLTEEAGLSRVPFAVELQATPVVQNEERVMCGDKLYLTETFIQNKFIDGRAGQRFTFDEAILLNVVNTTQSMQITPEEDMLLKVATKQAHGVNMAMRLCLTAEPSTEGAEQGAALCKTSLARSAQVGNNGLLFAVLDKGKSYTLVMDYTNSIITLSSFYDCPHADLRLSMMRVQEAKKVVARHASDKSGSTRKRESEAKLANFFNTLSRPAAELGSTVYRLEPDTIYSYPLEVRLGSKAQSHIITQRDFTIQEGAARQFLLEVFFDPQFYDLELLLESKDAGEVKAHSRSSVTMAEMTKYKGSKRIFVELEQGDYTFKVVAKVPGVDAKTKELEVGFYEYQLYAVAANTLPNKVLQPTSLNLLGMLGPLGENFGQFVHLVPQTLLGPQEHIDLEFTLAAPADGETGSPFLDVQVVNADGHGEQLDLRLVEAPKKAAQSAPKSNKAEGEIAKQQLGEPLERATTTSTQKRPVSSRYHDDWEDGVSYVALASSGIRHQVRYRISLKNRDASIQVKATLKLLIAERAAVPEGPGSDVHPQDFEEVKRVKPKVPGLKESAFIQGSKVVMQTFKVTTLQPFIPKSNTVYHSAFSTGPGTDNSFMKGLEFEVTETSSQLYAQVFAYTGPEDLFLALYRLSEGDSAQQVARSGLGRYANALGPAPLTAGKYRLVVHPNQESTSLPEGSHAFRFGLDVLLEQSSIGGAADFSAVVEEVELCNQRAIPEKFNGPGLINPLSGGTLQHGGKYKLAEILEGTAVKFDLPVPSLVTFYLEVPEGLTAEAALETVQGTH